MDIEIKSLTTDLIDDYLYFFDKVAFSDNPDWSACYCYFHHYPGSVKKWMKRTKQQNREEAKIAVLNGIINGFLAYNDNGKPIGWINADFKDGYVKTPFEEKIKPISEGKTASIVCMIIAPSHRKKGIARKLLKGALIELKERNIRWVEAYPRLGDLSDAHHYHGPLSLYESEGFSIAKELKNMVVVLKEI
jgi:GNAT superfamily N-acetyltransferase